LPFTFFLFSVLETKRDKKIAVIYDDTFSTGGRNLNEVVADPELNGPVSTSLSRWTLPIALSSFEHNSPDRSGHWFSFLQSNARKEEFMLSWDC
jgi:hypothetical protein